MSNTYLGWSHTYMELNPKRFLGPFPFFSLIYKTISLRRWTCFFSINSTLTGELLMPIQALVTTFIQDSRAGGEFNKVKLYLKYGMLLTFHIFGSFGFCFFFLRKISCYTNFNSQHTHTLYVCLYSSIWPQDVYLIKYREVRFTNPPFMVSGSSVIPHKCGKSSVSPTHI